MRRVAVVALGLAVGLSVVGCGRDGESGSSGGRSGRTREDVKTARLTEDEVKTYLDVQPGLAKIVEAGANDMQAGAMIGPRGHAHLESTGVDPDEFGQIVAKVRFAYAALNAKEMLEKAEGPGRAAAEQILAPYKNMPPENIELIRTYRDQFEAMRKELGGKAGGED